MYKDKEEQNIITQFRDRELYTTPERKLAKKLGYSEKEKWKLYYYIESKQT